MRATSCLALGHAALSASGAASWRGICCHERTPRPDRPMGATWLPCTTGLKPDPPDDHLIWAQSASPLDSSGLSRRRGLESCHHLESWQRTVGLVINEQRLALLDAATARETRILALIKADGYDGS